LVFGVALGIGGLLAAFYLFIDGASSPLGIVLGLAWIVGAALTGWRFGLWPCPRCGRPFAITSLKDWFGSMSGDQLRMLMTARCWHCGLPKWSPNDPDSLPGAKR
jgi:hypothetical protein